MTRPFRIELRIAPPIGIVVLGGSVVAAAMAGAPHPALRALVDQGRYLAILSNVDRDLLELSIGRLGIRPDLAVTAEDCHSYKPAPGHWRRFLERSGASVERTVHVGASQYHDMRPAAALGFRTIFIDRHGETRPARATW